MYNITISTFINLILPFTKTVSKPTLFIYYNVESTTPNEKQNKNKIKAKEK